MRKKTGIIEWAMRHYQIVLLITGLLVAMGIYALTVMPKQEYPIFTIRQGVVIGVYPGADSKTVEEQLTKPLEKYLFTYPEVNRKKTYSHSKEGFVFVFVELADQVKDKDIVWSKIKHGLTGFKSSLPSGVMAVIANDNFADVASLLITLESDDKTYRELDGYLDILENRLQRLPSVSNLNRYGSQKEQISIYIDIDKLTAYGIGSNMLMTDLFMQGFTTMSGTLDNGRMVAPIHIAETFATEKEIAEQIIYSDPLGNVIRVKDIGSVVREYPEADSYITNNGKKCILLAMEVRKGDNVVAFGKEVEAELEQFQKGLPESVNIFRIVDQPKLVSLSIETFLIELLMAIIAVILVTMILLPLRVAAVAASAIPLTICVSLSVMFFVGIPLNMITLAALIIVLGMIVDNSVVIVDSYVDKLDHGMSRWYASIASAKEYFKSILSATLAISITFFPFLITMDGTMYDFLEYFPWTVCLTLGLSLLIAMLVIPFFQYGLIRKGLLQVKRERMKGREERRTILDALQRGYEKLLAKVFDYPKLTLGTALLSVIVAGLMFVTIPQRMMPVVERDQFAVEIYLQQGSSLQQTAFVCDSVEHILQRDPRVLSITKFVGESSPRFHAVYAPNMPSKSFGQFIVNTTSAKTTVEMLTEYTDLYAFHFPEAYVKFKQLDFLAVAAPIEVRFYGENIEELKQQAEKLIDFLKPMDEFSWVRTNYEEVLAGARVELDPVEAGRLGIKKALVSMNLASNFGGMPITTLWEGDYALPVVLNSENRQPDFNTIGNVHVSGLIPGVSVPLRQVADIEPEWTEGQIAHRNGLRMLSVLADIKWNGSSKEVLAKVRQYMNAEIIPSIPEGIEIEYGGDQEFEGEVLAPLFKALAMAIIIIFFILVFHFRRLNMAVLVLSSSLLSLFGAAFGVWIMGIEFSVTAMLGIVSLVGIIVRNGIIMFDYTDELRTKQRMPVREAAFEAGKRRLRPIFLTSAAASMGVIPMVISKSLLWSPLGTVICFGTMISMIFVVTVLPVSYWLIFRKTDKYAVKNANL